MRQLPLAGLALSPALARADPRLIAQGGRAGQACADDLRRQAERLAALGGRTSAGWSGAGASSFVRAAAEQSKHVAVAADLIERFARAQSALAAALAGAQHDGLAAVARGRQLDADAEEINASARPRPLLALHDPDAALASDPRAEEIAARTRMAASDLSAAEARARQAWQAASAEFDVTGHGTPAVLQQMLTAEWDPAAHVGLASAGVVSAACGVMSRLGLPAGGVLTGPDGRAYPLVVQTALGADGTLLVSTQEQPSTIAGWNELAVRTGRTSFGPKASTWDKWAVALGAAAGAEYPMKSAFAPKLLDEVHIMQGGGAYLPAPTKEAAEAPGEVAGEALRGKKVVDYWTAPTTGLAAGRRTTTPDGIGLLDEAIGGFVASTRLDDGRAADYRVVFEESTTGQLRARLQLYRVLTAPDELPSTVSAAGYVDSSGRLAGAPVTGEDPQRRALLRPAGR